MITILGLSREELLANVPLLDPTRQAFTAHQARNKGGIYLAPQPTAATLIERAESLFDSCKRDPGAFYKTLDVGNDTFEKLVTGQGVRSDSVLKIALNSKLPEDSIFYRVGSTPSTNGSNKQTAVETVEPSTKMAAQGHLDLNKLVPFLQNLKPEQLVELSKYAMDKELAFYKESNRDPQRLLQTILDDCRLHNPAAYETIHLEIVKQHMREKFD